VPIIVIALHCITCLHYFVIYEHEHRVTSFSAIWSFSVKVHLLLLFTSLLAKMPRIMIKGGVWRNTEV